MTFRSKYGNMYTCKQVEYLKQQPKELNLQTNIRIMKTKSLLITVAIIASMFTSCVPVRIPIHRGGGYARGGPAPRPMMPPRPRNVPFMNEYNNNGGGYGGGHYGGRQPWDYNNGPNGLGQTIYHGSQARHVYGSGWQTFADGTIINVR